MPEISPAEGGEPLLLGVRGAGDGLVVMCLFACLGLSCLKSGLRGWGACGLSLAAVEAG